MSSEYGLGYLPDVRKVEDYTEQHPQIAPLLAKTTLKARGVAKAGELTLEPLPARVDLRQWFSPVETQGALNACSVHVAVGLLEYFQKHTTGSYVDSSRLFLYKVGRSLMNWGGDNGLWLRTAMQALVLFGAPPEQYWPYDGSAAASNLRYNLEPTPFVYALATNYKAVKYFRLDIGWTMATRALVLNEMKTYAAAGFPSLFGFPVYREYDNPLPGGLIAYPGPGTYYRGGHANIVAGYDDNMMIGQDKGALLVRNSWGTGWGDAGYGWLSYKYAAQGLLTDCWSMVAAEWVDTGVFLR